MRKNTGKLIMLIVVLVMVFSLVGCAGTDPVVEDTAADDTAADDTAADDAVVAAEDLTIGMYVPIIGHPYFIACKNGAEQAAEDFGFDLIWTGPSTYDSAEENAMIEDLIAQEVDILIASPGDAAGIAAVLNKAAAKDILVMCFDQDSPTSDRLFCVSAGESEITGKLYAEIMAEEIGYAGQVAITTGTIGADATDRRVAAVEDTLKQWPDIEVVAVEANEEDAEKGISQIENLIQTYPDLKGVIGVTSTGGYWAAQAIEAAGKAGEIKIVGMGMPTQCNEYIKNGTITATLMWDPAKMTYIAASAAIEYMQTGEMPEDGKDYGWGGSLAVNEATPYIGYVDDIQFTPENVDFFDF